MVEGFGFVGGPALGAAIYEVQTGLELYLPVDDFLLPFIF